MRIGLIVNTRRAKAAIVPGLVRYLQRQGHTVMTDPVVCRTLKLGCRGESDERFAARSELVVALGGDGTLLRAARLVGRRGIPIIGVNLGELGFLTEFTYQQAKSAISDFLKGDSREEQRMVLEVQEFKSSRVQEFKGLRVQGLKGKGIRCGIVSPEGGRKYFALNDVSINMGRSCRAIEVILSVNRTYVTRFVADGVVIATPTGSTAYSLAAGGPIVFPTLEAILITPLCPHALSARPLVAAPEETISIELGRRNTEAAPLVVDGQRRGSVMPGDRVLLRKSDFKVRLITPKQRSYYQILRNKMKWGGR